MRVKLNDLCEVKAGGTPSRSEKQFWDKGTIPWVKISDFDGKLLKYTTEYITEDGLNNSSAKLIKKGSILYTIFATLGEVCILDIDATTNQAIAGITIKDDRVELEYLYYFLKSLKSHVNSLGRGVAQNNINLSILRDFDIPLPSKEKQIEISQTLEKTYRIIINRQQQLIEYDQLIKSRFIEMFGDPILNPKGWDMEYLGNICDVRDGTHDSPKYVTDGFPLVTSKNVSSGYIDFSSVNMISEEDLTAINKRSKVDNGDIIMPMIGTVGNPILVSTEKIFAIKNVALIKFKEKSLVNNVYIKAVLESEYFENAVSKNKRGGTQKFIALGDIRKFLIQVPKLDHQNEFMSFVQHVDKLKFTVQRSLDETQILFDSLMQEYFG